MSLVGANGGRIPLSGIGLFNIQIGKLMIKTEFVIVNSDEITWPFTILGLTLLESMGSIIDLKNKNIQFRLDNGDTETIGFSQYISNVLTLSPSFSSHVIFQEEELLRSPARSDISDGALFKEIDELMGDTNRVKTDPMLSSTAAPSSPQIKGSPDYARPSPTYPKSPVYSPASPPFTPSYSPLSYSSPSPPPDHEKAAAHLEFRRALSTPSPPPTDRTAEEEIVRPSFMRKDQPTADAAKAPLPHGIDTTTPRPHFMEPRPNDALRSITLPSVLPHQENGPDIVSNVTSEIRSRSPSDRFSQNTRSRSQGKSMPVVCFHGKDIYPHDKYAEEYEIDEDLIVSEDDAEVLCNIIEGLDRPFDEKLDYTYFDLSTDKINLYKCDPNFQPTVRRELLQFKECFSKHNFDIGHIPYEFANTKFELHPGKRAYSPDYQKSIPELRLLKRLEEIFMHQGVLVPGAHTSLYRSNNFVVRKPGKTDYSKIGNYRLVNDCRGINRAAIPIASSLPFIETIRQKMSGFEYLTKLDVCNGFFSLPVHKDSMQYLQTTTAVGSGSLYYARTTQGLFCAPTCFQTAMARIVETITETIDGHDVKQFITVYVDDFYVTTFSGGSEFHWKVLKVLLSKLVEFNLKIRIDKLEAFTHSAMVLGLWTDKTFVSIDKSKVAVLENWEIPQNKKDIHVF